MSNEHKSIHEFDFGLIGEVDKDDIVKERKVVSCKVDQMRIFD
jgi:hypothetical protein